MQGDIINDIAIIIVYLMVSGERREDMKKLATDIYIHRGHLVIKDEQGICVENHHEIFPTWNDAREFINKMMDGTNKTEPRIIGTWKEQAAG